MKKQSGQIVAVLTIIALGVMSVGIGAATWLTANESSPFYSEATGCIGLSVTPTSDFSQYLSSYTFDATLCSEYSGDTQISLFSQESSTYINNISGGAGVQTIATGDCRTASFTVYMNTSGTNNWLNKAGTTTQVKVYGTSRNVGDWGCYEDEVRTLTFGTAATPTPTSTPGATATPTPTTTPGATATPTATPIPEDICCCDRDTNCSVNCQWMDRNECENVPGAMGEVCPDSACGDTPTATPTLTPAVTTTPTLTPTPTETPPAECYFKATVGVYENTMNGPLINEAFEVVNNKGQSFVFTGTDTYENTNLPETAWAENVSNTLKRNGVTLSTSTSPWQIVGSFCSSQDSDPASAGHCPSNAGQPVNPLGEPNDGFKIACDAVYTYGWLLARTMPEPTPTPGTGHVYGRVIDTEGNLWQNIDYYTGSATCGDKAGPIDVSNRNYWGCNPDPYFATKGFDTNNRHRITLYTPSHISCKGWRVSYLDGSGVTKSGSGCTTDELVILPGDKMTMSFTISVATGCNCSDPSWECKDVGSCWDSVRNENPDDYYCYDCPNVPNFTKICCPPQGATPTPTVTSTPAPGTPTPTSIPGAPTPTPTITPQCETSPINGKCYNGNCTNITQNHVNIGNYGCSQTYGAGYHCCAIQTTTPVPTWTPTPTKTPTPSPTKTPIPTPTLTPIAGCGQPSYTWIRSCGPYCPYPDIQCSSLEQCRWTTYSVPGCNTVYDCIPHEDCQPTPTPTPTPVPGTPTPTPSKACNEICDNDDECSTGSCYKHPLWTVSVCRNPNCPLKDDCNCPGPTSTPEPTPVGGICVATVVSNVCTVNPVANNCNLGYTCNPDTDNDPWNGCDAECQPSGGTGIPRLSAAVVDDACEPDGMVNALDYGVIVNNYGESGVPGDVNNDSVVNGIDISLTLRFLGQSVQ